MVWNLLDPIEQKTGGVGIPVPQLPQIRGEHRPVLPPWEGASSPIGLQGLQPGHMQARLKGWGAGRVAPTLGDMGPIVPLL